VRRRGCPRMTRFGQTDALSRIAPDRMRTIMYNSRPGKFQLFLPVRARRVSSRVNARFRARRGSAFGSPPARGLVRQGLRDNAPVRPLGARRFRPAKGTRLRDPRRAGVSLKAPASFRRKPPPRPTVRERGLGHARPVSCPIPVRGMTADVGRLAFACTRHVPRLPPHACRRPSAFQPPAVRFPACPPRAGFRPHAGAAPSAPSRPDMTAGRGAPAPDRLAAFNVRPLGLSARTDVNPPGRVRRAPSVRKAARRGGFGRPRGRREAPGADVRRRPSRLDVRELC
jgi:hypothetical protein